MDYHDREFFVSRLRAGYHIVNYNYKKIKIYPPTVEDEFEANVYYQKIYNRCLNDDLLTEEECHQLLVRQGLWTEKDDKEIEQAKKDIEKLKVEIYSKRNEKKIVARSRAYLRAIEKALDNKQSDKQVYYGNTCEAIAQLEKNTFLLKSGCYIGSDPLDDEDFDYKGLLNLYYEQILKESQIREIARTDPWRTYWSLKDSTKLFKDNGRELTVDQKNLLIWAKMYDSINESMDAPSDQVINDDDMLDGWFILQRKKSEKEKGRQDLESSLNNDKIANSSEVFVFAQDHEHAARIEELNDITGKVVKKERLAVIKNQGEASDLDFKDQKIRLGNQRAEQFKSRFRS
jgi:hypothetical protein